MSAAAYCLLLLSWDANSLVPSSFREHRIKSRAEFRDDYSSSSRKAIRPDSMPFSSDKILLPPLDVTVACAGVEDYRGIGRVVFFERIFVLKYCNRRGTWQQMLRTFDYLHSRSTQTPSFEA
jgi:hypothetical protein